MIRPLLSRLLARLLYPILVLAVAIALPFLTTGIAEAVAVTTIVDQLTLLPGQTEPFSVFGSPPASDGNKVVFAIQSNTRQLWTANPGGNGFIKLADSNTLIPGGTGHFGDVFPFRISNGTVVFRGNDDNQ